MRIFDYRINGFSLSFLIFELVKTLARAPAIIATLCNQVHLLPFILANISGPKLAGVPIETHAPDVAQTISPNLRPHTFRLSVEGISFRIAIVIFTDERIIFRDSERQFARSGIDIQSQDLS